LVFVLSDCLQAIIIGLLPPATPRPTAPWPNVPRHCHCRGQCRPQPGVKGVGLRRPRYINLHERPYRLEAIEISIDFDLSGPEHWRHVGGRLALDRREGAPEGPQAHPWDAPIAVRGRRAQDRQRRRRARGPKQLEDRAGADAPGTRGEPMFRLNRGGSTSITGRKCTLGFVL